MKQCHVLLIKGNGHYAVMGVYSPSEDGKHTVSENKPLIIPSDIKSVPQKTYSHTNPDTSSHSTPEAHSVEGKGKRKRDGKGSNVILLVRRMLKSPENWKYTRLPVSGFLHYAITTTTLLHPRLFSISAEFSC